MISASNDNGGDSPLPDDLEHDPEIGQSKGTFATGKDPKAIDGENTVEGDVQNDSAIGGGADPEQTARTNE